jgi:dolichol kinase
MSAVRDHDTVGSDISSATHGSSVASVAGKKRAPTKQWANASVQGSAANSSASATAREQM